MTIYNSRASVNINYAVVDNPLNRASISYSQVTRGTAKTISPSTNQYILFKIADIDSSISFISLKTFAVDDIKRDNPLETFAVERPENGVVSFCLKVNSDSLKTNQNTGVSIGEDDVPFIT